MHSRLCVSLCEGHSTVPYIKLSAPQLSSSSKWSLIAWGGVCLPTLNQKLRVSQALGHWFCESSNSEDKDGCLSFYLWVCLWTLTGFCAVCLSVHCIPHLQSCSVFFVVKIMTSSVKAMSRFPIQKANAQAGCIIIYYVSSMLSTLTWSNGDLLWKMRTSNSVDRVLHIKELEVISVVYQVSLLMLI